jgi:hypothetical protein
LDTNIADQPVSTSTVIDNEYATLRYHPGSKIVHHTFHQPTSGAAFREIVNTGVELLRVHKATKWLSDDRLNFALPEDDTAWGKINWFPQALEAGWKYWALVVPADIRARLNLKEFVEAFSLQGLRIMVFTTPEQGLAWLSSVDAAE